MTESDEFSFLEGGDRLPLDSTCLPLEFLNEHAEDAWLAVLGSKRRIKELADKLRKLKIETVIQRKYLRVLPDDVLLGFCYSMPTFSQQLIMLVPPQQFDAMSPRTLARRFVVDLLGTRTVELNQILSMRSHQSIKERICTLLPEAQEMFDQGWGASVYPGLLTLAYLLEIANFTDAGTDTHYQASFTLHAILLELLHTPILGLTIERAAKHPSYKAVYAGLSTLQNALKAERVTDANAPLPLADSMAAALMEVASDVLDSDSDSVLRAHELLFSLSGPGHQGLRKAAEEFVGFNILTRLHWVTAKATDALRTAGISDGVAALPTIPETWSLLPTDTWLSPAHFRVLQPLIGLEDDYMSESWDEQAQHLATQAVEAAKTRQEIGRLIACTNVDPVLITAAAGRLNEQTAKVTLLANSLISEIKNVIRICNEARDEWNNLVREMANPTVASTQLSESASLEDKEMLDIALVENQSLRNLLQDSRLQLHQMTVKAEALEHHQAIAYMGPVLNPVLTRKVVSSPSSLTPVEVLTYIQHVGGQSVRVLPSAWRSAEESAHFALSDRMLEILDRLVFLYAPRLADGQPDTVAKEILGTNYSAQESEQVDSNPALRFERTFTLDGRQHYFGRHLMVGNDPGRVRGMRIHFDILDGIVIIAYAGKHLTVVSTN